MRARTRVTKPTTDISAARACPASQRSRYVAQSPGSVAGVQPFRASLTGALNTKKGHEHDGISHCGDNRQQGRSAVCTPYDQECQGGRQCADLSGAPEEWPPASVEVLLHSQPEHSLEGELVWKLHVPPTRRPQKWLDGASAIRELRHYRLVGKVDRRYRGARESRSFG